MVTRLGEVTGLRLRITCAPCRRDGFYRLVDLIAEHGAERHLDALRVMLSADCRWRRPAGMREPGKYEPKCQARLVIPNSGLGLGGFDTFRGGGAVFRIDVWRDDDSGIDVEVLLSRDLALACRWYEDVVNKYPGRLVTLRNRAAVLMSTERRLPHGTGGW